MGKAGSGKDTFVNALIEGNYIPRAKPIISCTTRPIRDNECDGINYHYLTTEEFSNQVLEGKMLEATVFNNWFYGTSFENLDEHCLNIGVFNPKGVELLQSKENVDVEVVYLYAEDKVRLLRQLNREDFPDCKEIVRRFNTDEEDFEETRIEKIHANWFITNNNNYGVKQLAKDFAGRYLEAKANKLNQNKN